MAATPAQELLEEAKCYACLGVSVQKQLKLSLLRRTLIALVPAADTSVEGLVSYAKCYACFGVSQAELVELALLDQISQNI